MLQPIEIIRRNFIFKFSSKSCVCWIL